MNTKKKIRWFYAGWIFVWSVVGFCASGWPPGADLTKANTGVPLWIARFSQFMVFLGFAVFLFWTTKNQQAKAAPENDEEKAWKSQCGKKKRTVD